MAARSWRAYMKGPAPWRRTLDYLEEGQLLLNPNIKVLMFYFTMNRSSSEGLRRFVFYELARLQYKNPFVQMLQFEDTFPNPFITLLLNEHNSTTSFHIDCYNLTRDQIEHKFKLLASKKYPFKNNQQNKENKLTDKLLQQLSIAQLDRMNSANFGNNTDKKCICSHLDHFKCPCFKRIPEFMKGKNNWKSNVDKLEQIRSEMTDEEAVAEYWSRV